MFRTLIALSFAACAEPAPMFEPDPDPGGPALLVDAEPDGNHAHVRIVARGLGPVLGLAAHVVVDPSALAMTPGDDEALRSTLDPGDGAVRALLAMDEGDLALGTTRTSVAAGEVEVDDDLLVELEIEALRAGPSTIAIDRVIVRRADGSFTSVAALGGTLTLEAP